MKFRETHVLGGICLLGFLAMQAGSIYGVTFAPTTVQLFTGFGSLVFIVFFVLWAIAWLEGPDDLVKPGEGMGADWSAEQDRRP